jgi:hypothetical protein
MATNKLMEAAADILAGSKKSAPAEPMHKAEESPVELGGPKQDVNANKPGGDIYDKYKVDGSKSAKKAEDPKTKPSAASAEMAHKTLPKQYGEESETGEEVMEEGINVSEDIDALFADDSTISEEFKAKAATIFEARVLDRVTQIQEQLEAEYAQMFEEAIESATSELTEKVDDYLNYVVEQWMADNEIAIESGLRSELTEEFIAGLRNLFAEHYIDVPEEKVDLVDELASKVEELEGKLDEEIERGIQYRKALIESVKVEIAREVCEGLTETQVEKIKSLAESVEFSTEDEYKDKLETIRENYFPSGVKKANEEQLHEQVEEETAEKRVIADPFVAAVSQAISKTKIN